MHNERRTPQDLADLQARKLRRLIAHACEYVPFYRRLFQDAGVTAGDIRNPADLVRLPVVDKEMLRSQAIGDLVDHRRSPEDLIERHTSGSSGSPFRFLVDAAYDQHCKAQYLRPYLTNGRSLLDRVLHFTSSSSRPRKWFTRAGLLRSTRVGCSQPVDRLLAVLNEEHADIVQGYPSVLSSLANRIDAARRGFRSPRRVFTDSELLIPDARRRIERAFGAPVFDVFGTFETDNIAYECSEHAGYHLAIDCVVVEFLRDGKPVTPGESGDLVCTVLNNFAMPFIRYKLGDIAAALPGYCRCGRNLPMMKVIEGRSVDCMLMPDGTMQSPMNFLLQMDALGELALEYQVVQTEADAFVVRLVPARDVTSADRKHLSDFIVAQCPGARVSVEQVEHIEREPSGKRRTFICQH